MSSAEPNTRLKLTTPRSRPGLKSQPLDRPSHPGAPGVREFQLTNIEGVTETEIRHLADTTGRTVSESDRGMLRCVGEVPQFIGYLPSLKASLSLCNT